MTERIGRYELVKTLAEGDRGKLYLARAPGYGGFARHVVLKTFDQLPGAAEGSFLEETSDLGRLHHQHITPVLDVGRDGDRFYIALDYVHGRSAREIFQQTLTIGAALPLDFALSILVAIAAGLHHAHTRKIIHGHVSLSNILVGFDGTIRLAGFVGASVRGLRASETQLGFSKDQLAYLAPEQARRAGPIDPRSDVFSLGTILYELTTMRRAFRDDSDRLTIERVKAASYRKPRAILPEYPPELERIITRALQLDPGARYPDAELFRREVTAVGHHLELVLGDTAIVDVMGQLFEDGAADPWTSDAPAAPAAPPPQPRKLRAATEAVDALAIELEIPIQSARQDATTNNETSDDTRTTDPHGAQVAPAAPGNVTTDDTRMTAPHGVKVAPATPSNETTDDTRTTAPHGVKVAPAAPTTDDDTRATNPHGAMTAHVAVAARTIDGDGAPARLNDTDGVPVLVPLPTTPPRAATPASTVAAAAPQPRRALPFRTILVIAAIATVAITTVVALALRGTGGSGAKSKAPLDAAAVVVVVDAAAPPPPPDAAIDAAPADASTTVRIQITSTPSNATVLLDGKKLGKTPYDGVVERAEGKHVIKVRLGNHVTGKVDADLTADVQADIALERAAPSPDAGAPAADSTQE